GLRPRPAAGLGLERRRSAAVVRPRVGSRREVAGRYAGWASPSPAAWAGPAQPRGGCGGGGGRGGGGGGGGGAVIVAGKSAYACRPRVCYLRDEDRRAYRTK